MTRYLLDTNIVREAFKPRPSAVIAEWMQRQNLADLFIATLTVAEIWRGVLTSPAGRPRRPLDMIIAATAAANGCTVVTLNERDFRGAVDCLNPLGNMPTTQ